MYKILVGNKCDLDEKRQVSYEQGKEFADNHGMKFLETSAKTAFNVGDSFISMSKDIIKISQAKEINNQENHNKIELNTGKAKNISKKDCCK